MIGDKIDHVASIKQRHIPETSLPQVSVIIINHNYGKYLEDAVESVFAQTYRNIECIVVDNASTDQSIIVIEEMRIRHPSLKCIHRNSNEGQTAASLDGLHSSHGKYVIFLDADDFLLPKGIETHVYVHLSMRAHVGFTSGDMIQITDDEVVVANGEESNRYIRSGKGRHPELIRPYDGHEAWPSASIKIGIVDKLHYVPPLAVRWVWSPTSGLCYRRDALMLFADNAKLTALSTGTDVYFAYGCSGLSGSVIIDEPVFAYRIHDANSFTVRAQLDRTLNYVPGCQGDKNVLAQLYLIDHVVAHACRFTPNTVLKFNFIALLYRLDLHDLDPTLPKWAKRSRVAQAMVQNWDEMKEILGWAARGLLFVFSGSLIPPKSLEQSLRKRIAARKPS